MEESIRSVSTEQKEATAILVMRCMLILYSEQKGIPFEEALLSFAASMTYGDLFDFETEIWKEGPAYLLGLYEEELDARG